MELAGDDVSAAIGLAPTDHAGLPTEAADADAALISAVVVCDDHRTLQSRCSKG
jgi:hypothetical protein